MSTFSDILDAIRDDDVDELTQLLREFDEVLGDPSLLDEESMLREGCIYESAGCLKILLDRGILHSVPKALWQIVCLSEMDVLYHLDSLGPLDFNKKNKKGISILGYIFHNATLERIEFLLQRGADPNCIATTEDTLLVYSLKSKQYDKLRLLLKYGARPREPILLGLAIASSMPSVVELLLAHGADPNYIETNASGNGASYLHPPRCDGTMCMSLIRYGCKHVDLPDRAGFTPLDYTVPNSERRKVILAMSVVPTPNEETAEIRFQVHFRHSLVGLLIWMC